MDAVLLDTGKSGSVTSISPDSDPIPGRIAGIATSVLASEVQEHAVHFDAATRVMPVSTRQAGMQTDCPAQVQPQLFASAIAGE
jgi:hypothetical protein